MSTGQLQTEKSSLSYEEWKQQLITVTSMETGQSESSISINDDAAREWYDSGVPPYFTFRETYR